MPREIRSVLSSRSPKGGGNSRTSFKKVDSLYLKTEDWEQRTVVLVMGGGVCTVWDNLLGETGVRKIRDFVFAGGKFLGFCAGAYMASARICYQSNEKKRPLSFFSGRAVGPLVATDEPLSLEAARAAKVSNTNVSGFLYYQGGSYFEEAEGVEVVWRYDDLAPGKAAAVFCRVGKGCAFLCGLHPEFSWRDSFQENANSLYAKLAETLSLNEEFRERFWVEVKEKLSLR